MLDISLLSLFWLVFVLAMVTYVVWGSRDLLRNGLPGQVLLGMVAFVLILDVLLHVVFDRSVPWLRFVSSYILTPLLILGFAWFVARPRRGR